MNFSIRSGLPELMDAPDLADDVYRRCLADLARVNRATLTHRATLHWLARATKNLPRGAQVSVLDIGYGQGDLLRAIARWAARRGLRVRLSGIDLNPRSALAARAATPAEQKIDYHTGNVFEFVPPEPVDFIVTSQFTHHLGQAEIILLLRWMEKHARRGWQIADLHRHWLAYYGFPLLARLMRWHGIVRHDGQISIARAFTRADWQGVLAQTGIDAGVAWKFPFRWHVSRLQ